MGNMDGLDFTNIPQEISDKIEQVFKDIAAAKQQLGEFEGETRRFRFCLLQNHLDEVFKKCQSLAVHEGKLRKILVQVMSSFREGKCGLPVLENAIAMHENSEFSMDRINQVLGSWKHLTEKINFVKELRKSGASYIGKGGNFDRVVAENFSATICAFFMNDGEMVNRENFELYMQEFREHCVSTMPKYRCYVIDCGFHAHLWPGKLCVQLLREGAVIEEDVAQKKQQAAGVVIVKLGSGAEKFEEDFLPDESLLTKLPNEINILILGETGIGKSTWINAFFNFYHFEKLEDARKSGKCLTLIPCRFFVSDANFKQIEVTTGTSANECHEGGQSSTQDPKVYSFFVGDTVVRLIDTPGIGDVRGVKKDKENFDKILSTVSNYDKIHGICILLKPNHSKLNVVFNFCIMELLTHLHRDACENIVFCFTNSRSTFYKPGDTVEPLAELLKKYDINIPLTRETMYCFDSESYRFLAALCNPGHPVEFSEKETKDFELSWEKSYMEAARLMNHFLELPPHNTKKTVSLNNARRTVQQLSVPLAELSRMILSTVKSVEEEKREVQTKLTEMSDLEKIKMVQRPTIQREVLAYPMTVCGHENCMEVVNETVYYPQECHDHCYLSGIPENTVGHHGLINCWSQVNGKCRWPNCSHSYKSHLHIYFRSLTVQETIEDEAVVEALKKNLTFQETKEHVLQRKEAEIAEMNAEMVVIQKASAKFACFLKMSAIVPYNDALLQYLDHLIKEEQQLMTGGAATNVLEELRLLKKRYVEEKRVLEEAMNTGDTKVRVMTPGEVDQQLDTLCQLRKFGSEIRKIKETLASIPCNFQEERADPDANIKSENQGFWKRWLSKFTGH